MTREDTRVLRPRASFRPTALIVDDSPSLRALLMRTLRALDMQCLEASDGEEALRVLDEGFAPDLIVTELPMKPMDGWELMRRLEERRRRRRIPVLVLTSEFGPGLEDALRIAGADAYLWKLEMNVSLFRRMAQDLLAMSAAAR